MMNKQSLHISICMIYRDHLVYKALTCKKIRLQGNAFRNFHKEYENYQQQKSNLAQTMNSRTKGNITISIIRHVYGNFFYWP